MTAVAVSIWLHLFASTGGCVPPAADTPPAPRTVPVLKVPEVKPPRVVPPPKKGG